VVNFATTIVPILVAIITVTVPIFITSFSNLASNKPAVNVLITPNFNNDGRKAVITLTNNGSAPATNLSLTLIAPRKVTQITDNFSTSSISLPQIANHNNSLTIGVTKSIHPTPFLQINMPKLIQGDGSLAILQTLNEGNASTHYNNYTVHIVSDQGSIVRVGLVQPSIWTSSWKSLVSSYPILQYLLFFYIIFLALYYSLYYKWLGPRTSRRQFMIQIRSRILLIHHDLYKKGWYGVTYEGPLYDSFKDQWENKHCARFFKSDITFIELYWMKYRDAEYYVRVKDINEHISV
jgi:hypothetical protein